MRVEMHIGGGVGHGHLDMEALPRVGEHVEFELRGRKRRFQVVDVIHRIEVDEHHLGWRRPPDLAPLVLFQEVAPRSDRETR